VGRPVQHAEHKDGVKMRSCDLRALALWLCFGAATVLGQTFIDTDTAVVTSATQLYNALALHNSSTIYVINDIDLAQFPTEGVDINRRVTITVQYPVVQKFTINVANLTRGSALRCYELCELKITGGLSFINNNYPIPSDLSAGAVPSFIGTGGNGTLVLDSVNVYTGPKLYGMWDPVGLVHQRQHEWWVGNLTLQCRPRPTELLIVHWTSEAKNRDNFLQNNRTNKSYGWIRMDNVLSVLDRNTLCTPAYWTATSCQAAAQVCSSFRANASYSNITALCSAELRQDDCSESSHKPPPPPVLVVDTPPESDSSSSSKLGIGLGVGLGVGLGLAAILAGALFVLSRRKHMGPPAGEAYLASGGEKAGDKAGAGAGGVRGAAGAANGGGPPRTTSGVASSSIVNSKRHDHHSLSLQSSRTSSKAHTMPSSDAEELEAMHRAAAANAAHGKGHVGSTTTTITNNMDGRPVVIEVAPALTTVQQLARNPLGVTLTHSLGTGAFGQVFAGAWQGQEVAVKVVKHNVADQEDLDVILEVKEAALGAELDHPRVVRCLAHALVVPEGAIDEHGRLLRTTTVEAHIVSQLCDRGTLKEWLSTLRLLGHSCSAAASLPPLLSRANPGNAAATTGNAVGSQPSMPVSPARTVSGMTAAMYPPLMLPSAGGGTVDASQAGIGGTSSLSGPHCSDGGCQGNGAAAAQQQQLGPLSLQLHCDYTRHLVAVLDVLAEIADGLTYLLSKGVVHGDLKLQNCLCCTAQNERGFTVKICDFGISRVIHASKSHTTVSTPPGTLAYFAPELLSTCHLSPSCDLYSFGILMYELAACKQPFAAMTMAQVLYSKATGSIDTHLPFPPNTPPAYIELARHCWAVQPSQRPPLPDVQQRLAAIRAELASGFARPGSSGLSGQHSGGGAQQPRPAGAALPTTTATTATPGAPGV